MKQRTKAPCSAPGHCYFKRFSSKTEDGEQCGTQSPRSERCAGSSTVSSFSKAEERGGAGGESKSAKASRGRVGVKDRNTGGDKAPHPPEALVFTAPFAPRRRCDAKKHASTWPELQGALCALCSSSSSPSTNTASLLIHPPHAAIFQDGKKGKETRRLQKKKEGSHVLFWGGRKIKINRVKKVLSFCGLRSCANLAHLSGNIYPTRPPSSPLFKFTRLKM